MPITIREIAANGFTFRCREAGTAGEPVILLHGFPETSHMWLPLLDALDEAGYRALAPDQRGYSPGARPEGADAYAYPNLVADVMALADAAGFDTFHLIGHDHGAGVGWTAVYTHPDRIRSWTALSVPHIAAFGEAIRNDADQQQRSQYIGFFQQPGAAEATFSENDFAALRGIWSASSPEEKEEYLSVFREPGALTAALNWYRGSLRTEGRDATAEVGAVSTPTLMIWGNRDQAIGRRANEEAAKFMSGPYRFVELDAGHWLIQEAPGRVIAEILQHLRANPIGR